VTRGRFDNPATPAPVLAFERLHHRSPSDDERRELLRIQSALGLENTSEMWLLVLVLQGFTARMTADADRLERALAGRAADGKAQPGATLGAKLDSVGSSLAGFRQQIEDVAANVRQDLIESTLAQTATASELRMAALQSTAVDAICAAVKDGLRDLVVAAAEAAVAERGAPSSASNSVQDALAAKVAVHVAEELRAGHAAPIGALLRGFAVAGAGGFFLGALVSALAISYL
jgi:hypothetical protein